MLYSSGGEKNIIRSGNCERKWWPELFGHPLCGQTKEKNAITSATDCDGYRSVGIWVFHRFFFFFFLFK